MGGELPLYSIIYGDMLYGIPICIKKFRFWLENVALS